MRRTLFIVGGLVLGLTASLIGVGTIAARGRAGRFLHSSSESQTRHHLQAMRREDPPSSSSG